MTFRPGMKVVCVDAKLSVLARIIKWIFRLEWPLVNGEVYTIQRLTVISGEAATELVEVKNIPEMARCFRLSRFRPIVSRKTDISALKALLVPGAKIRETA